MIAESQADIITALSNPKNYAYKVKSVEVRQSHIAILFLAGDKVYKLKRAVLYPEADLSTREKRRLACVHEMKRSAVYAPNLVEKIESVRRLPSGKIVIGGTEGEEIDTILVMKRIPDKYLLNHLLPSSKFDRFEAMDLAEKLADLHKKAKILKNKWGTDTIKRLILENESVLSCFCPDIFEKKKLEDLTRNSLQALAQNSRLIRLRQKSGAVRKCHGDLLLSNIAWTGTEFIFFSPIEYNENLCCIDTLYDLAEVLMDLEAIGERRLTNILFNHYMAHMNDISGFPLLPLYQALRATRRAAVCAKKSTLMHGWDRRRIIREARHYFDLAQHFISGKNPVLVACGGLSGSGKSRIARELGGYFDPAPGAVILRDDIIKKQIMGLAPTQTLDKQYDTPAFEEVVYDVLRQQARMALSVGSCVILDALFYNPAERQAAEDLAQSEHAPFIGLWMDAPVSIREERIKTRLRNPSDVKERAELDRQLNLDTGKITWTKIMTDTSRDKTLQKALAVLKKVFHDQKK
ncbi:MAG: AAA family ATPase [Alphaproteobacteria bacterium]|nr:AAA family ATPase [Alphaproteobacteria bacterium]